MNMHIETIRHVRLFMPPFDGYCVMGPMANVKVQLIPVYGSRVEKMLSAVLQKDMA